jgi:hypothetical protein
MGKKIETPEGRGKVIRQNLIDRRVTVLLESGQEIELEIDASEPRKKKDK